MSTFGIEREKERANQGIGNHRPRFYDAGDSTIRVPATLPDSADQVPCDVVTVDQLRGREEKRIEGVYTFPSPPYNSPSLLIAEPRNEAEAL